MAVIRCPYCGKENDQFDIATHHDERSPSSGDIGICFTCGHFAIFETSEWGLTQRQITDDELQQIKQDPKALKVAEFIKKYRGVS